MISFLCPITYECVANTSKTNRLKERREEDSRLGRMGIDSSHQPVPRLKETSQVSHRSLEAETTHLNTSDQDIEQVHEEPCVCPFKYHPVDDNWQIITLENLGLTHICSNGVSSGGPDIPLTLRASIKSIIGDGSCLFRSLSYIISGPEDQHFLARQTITNQIRAISHLLCEYCHVV